MASYEDVLSIDTFLGINQSREDNTKLSYAVEGKNFLTTHGVLQSVGDPHILSAGGRIAIGNSGVDLGHEITAEAYSLIRGGTLAFLAPRWKQGVSGIIPNYSLWAIAVVDGKLYARCDADGISHLDSQFLFYSDKWTELLNPETGKSFAFQENIFDKLTYELSYAPPEILTSAILQDVKNETKQYFVFDLDDYKYHEISSDGTAAYYTDDSGEEIALGLDVSTVRRAYSESPVDALLISNAYDGMYCIYAPLDSEMLSVVRVPVAPGGGNEMKFGCIELHSERIWGSGILGEPDKMVYSAPGDVFNWEQNNKTPEDGAGDIQQPEWDGDRFVALKTFGSHLLAIKEHSLWRIVGTNPVEYIMKKQYGMGTSYPRSVQVYNAYAYMVSEDGILIYDGSTTRHLKYGALDKWNFISYVADDEYRYTNDKIACMMGDVYCVTIDTGQQARVVHYNTQEHTFGFMVENHTGETISNQPFWQNGILDYAQIKGQMFALNWYEADTGDIDEMENIKTICCASIVFPFQLYTDINNPKQRPMEWVSAWQDMGAKNITKSAFEIWITIDTTGFYETLPFTVGIETEKKLKSKDVLLQKGKAKRIRLNNSGKRFRLLLSTETQETWFLRGGIQIRLEYDYD